MEGNSLLHPCLPHHNAGVDISRTYVNSKRYSKQSVGSRKNQRRGGNRANKRGVQNVDLIPETRFSNSRDMVMTCSRTATYVDLLVPTTGWGGSGLFDLEFSFSLTQMLVYRGGTLFSTTSITGGTDFTPLFEEWRINTVEIGMMYGANSVAPGPTTGPIGPILLAVFDPNDTSAVSLSSILQYNGVRVIQIANVRGESGACYKFQPRIQSNSASNAAGVAILQPPSQWISTDAPTAPHNGFKVFYDSAASTYASTIGSVSFYVKLNYSFRGTK